MNNILLIEPKKKPSSFTIPKPVPKVVQSSENQPKAQPDLINFIDVSKPVAETQPAQNSNDDNFFEWSKPEEKKPDICM